MDRGELLARFDGNRSVIRRLVAALRRELEADLPELEMLIASRNGPALAAAAHGLKGSLGNFCDDRSHGLARRLEELARAADFEGCLRTLGDLRERLDSLVPELEAIASE